MMRALVPLIVLSITVACGNAEARRHSAKTTCAAKLEGEWKFGRAPYGCALDAKTSQRLENKYSDFVFDDAKNRDNESLRFTSNMYDYLTEYSTAYYKRRSPQASDDEIEQWNLLVLSTANQESYWTHFRRGRDQRFRFFKGDNGHAYGLMQIDNRWHRSFISSKKVYDLTENFVYALDILYQARKKAIKSPCDGKDDNISISRSSYAAFNGGPGARCRWTSPKNKWARNDKNFYNKISNRAWEPLVSRSSSKSREAVASNN